MDESRPVPAETSIQGDPDAIRAAVEAYSEAGVDLLIVDPPEQPLDALISQLRTFAAVADVTTTAT
jgi:hypothetical protein